MKNTFIYTALLSTLSMASCSGWSTNDDNRFKEYCLNNKMDVSYCDCALSKLKEEFSSYNKITEDEEKLAIILVDCIEQDTTDNEK